MKKDVLMIDLPQYRVEYSDKKYSYLPGKGRENLKKALYKASRNYCMYCYNRIKIDGNEYGHLEHAIESSIAPEKLKNCIPNIGIACPVCNDKYKKIGEKQRVPDNQDIDDFKKGADCRKEFCRKPCEAYQRLKRAYLTRSNAQFLMQPLGVSATDIGGTQERVLKLQYDVLNNTYIPSKKERYSPKEKDFLMHHIDMFGLNSVDRKSTQMVKFLKDTIQKEGHYTELECNNQVVELFIETVLKGKSAKEVLKICENLYTYVILKFNVSE